MGFQGETKKSKTIYVQWRKEKKRKEKKGKEKKRKERKRVKCKIMRKLYVLYLDWHPTLGTQQWWKYQQASQLLLEHSLA